MIDVRDDAEIADMVHARDLDEEKSNTPSGRIRGRCCEAPDWLTLYAGITAFPPIRAGMTAKIYHKPRSVARTP
jgi:hypothetical protein